MFSLRTHAIICAALLRGENDRSGYPPAISSEKAGVRLSGAGRIITMVVFCHACSSPSASGDSRSGRELVLGAPSPRSATMTSQQSPPPVAAENTIIWTLWGLQSSPGR